jgi:hypothetical protein
MLATEAMIMKRPIPTNKPKAINSCRGRLAPLIKVKGVRDRSILVMTPKPVLC